jgi:hypothetical protein
MIREACDRGFDTFDLNRSPVESGTYAFKKGWGAEPKPLTYLFRPETEAVASPTATFGPLIHVWRKLPRPVTNTIGPLVTRFLTDL